MVTSSTTMNWATAQMVSTPHFERARSVLDSEVIGIP